MLLVLVQLLLFLFAWLLNKGRNYVCVDIHTIIRYIVDCNYVFLLINIHLDLYNYFIFINYY